MSKQIIFQKNGNFVFHSNIKEWLIKEGKNYRYFRAKDKYSEKRSLKVVILNKFDITNLECLTFDFFQFGLEKEIRNSNLYGLKDFEIDVPFLYLYPAKIEPKEKLVFIQGSGKDCTYSSGNTQIESETSEWNYNWVSYSTSGNHRQEYFLILNKIENIVKATYGHGHHKWIKELLIEI